jgi:hypothetical protein
MFCLIIITLVILLYVTVYVKTTPTSLPLPPSPLPIYEAKLCLKNLQLRPRLYGASGIITWPSGHTRLPSLLLTSFAPSIAFCTRAPIFIILSYSLNPTCLQFSPLVTYIVYIYMSCMEENKDLIWFDLIINKIEYPVKVLVESKSRWEQPKTSNLPSNNYYAAPITDWTRAIRFK